MIDLIKLLKEDDKYKEILSACSNEEKDFLKEYIENYLSMWQEQFFNPLQKISDDKELSNAVNKELIKIKKE